MENMRGLIIAIIMAFALLSTGSVPVIIGTLGKVFGWVFGGIMGILIILMIVFAGFNKN